MVPLGSSEVRHAKSALRDQMRARRGALSASERRVAAALACERLMEMLTAHGELAGKIVAAYVAVRGELDPAPAVAALRAAGARIALPRAEERSSGEPWLSFECVEAGTLLRPGKFGIPEPGADALVSVRPPALDVVIAPGLAFDAAGRRLGSGGGYYDRTFDRWPDGRPGLLVGFGYDFQVVDRCPVDEHDVEVDLVVTDRRVLRPDAEPSEAGS